jgi:hypothetical protein
MAPPPDTQDPPMAKHPSFKFIPLTKVEVALTPTARGPPGEVVPIPTQPLLELMLNIGIPVVEVAIE